MAGNVAIVAQLVAFADLHQVVAAFVPTAEDAPALAIDHGIAVSLGLTLQLNLGRAGRAQQQPSLPVPDLEGDLALVLVLARRAGCMVVVDLVLELRGDQPGRLRQMGIEHLADFLARIEIGERRRRQPGGQHGAREQEQQAAAQGRSHPASLGIM
jgi:hypothetical protein